MEGMKAWKETHVVNGVEVIVGYCPMGQIPPAEGDKVVGRALFCIPRGGSRQGETPSPYAEILKEIAFGNRCELAGEPLVGDWGRAECPITDQAAQMFVLLGLNYQDWNHVDTGITYRRLRSLRYRSQRFEADTYAEVEAECISCITTEMQRLFDAWSDREAALAFAEGRPAPERRVFRLHREGAERKEKIRALEQTIAGAQKELRELKRSFGS